MSTTVQDSGGVEPQAGGNEETVSYETHQRLLGEKKRAVEEAKKAAEEKAEAKKQLNELLRQRKEEEEAKLKANEEYKKILEIREKELNEVKAELTNVHTTIAESRKFQAVIESINGSVDKQYWSLIPTEKVAVDPSTGQPDPVSVQAVAREFEKNFALVVKPKTGVQILPNEAAKGGTEKLTVDQWKALPTSKEMKAKKHLVDFTT